MNEWMLAVSLLLAAVLPRVGLVAAPHRTVEINSLGDCPHCNSLGDCPHWRKVIANWINVAFYCGL